MSEFYDIIKTGLEEAIAYEQANKERQNMIYVTGDLHRTFDYYKLTVDAFPEQCNMTKDDYVIVLGDFGGIWDGNDNDERWIRACISSLPFTTLWIDGNHENFNALEQYPVTQWHGGNVQMIAPDCIHLMRGQVYTIEGRSFFTMGGASSHDKAWRKEGVSWWSQELPCDGEYIEALGNLDAVDWKVDYVLTHCAPDSVSDMFGCEYEHDKLTNFLETVRQDLNYDTWLFGHYHRDKKITEHDICLYDQIVRII